ncbi:hypothetical protein [Bacillus thuringiensis]|uniref:Uncharacterized protein n=1 Tax=Bacillus thuringiensis TaxID=1428 RepID=A0A9X6WHF2_BACTU|nr:hypothetical protein [Bacillus thuringiensis]PFJ28982.1 hypothetical protein COJ15_32455 [Bacillus thuringiensis]
MSKELSGIIKNSLFAMVDLFLDYVSGESVDSQIENISEFIIDCTNLKPEEPEFELIKLKFEEEFENANFFVELEKDEVMERIEKSVTKLVQDLEVPPLVLQAINKSY